MPYFKIDASLFSDKKMHLKRSVLIEACIINPYHEEILQTKNKSTLGILICKFEYMYVNNSYSITNLDYLLNDNKFDDIIKIKDYDNYLLNVIKYKNLLISPKISSRIFNKSVSVESKLSVI